MTVVLWLMLATGPWAVSAKLRAADAQNFCRDARSELQQMELLAAIRAGEKGLIRRDDLAEYEKVGSKDLAKTLENDHASSIQNNASLQRLTHQLCERAKKLGNWKGVITGIFNDLVILALFLMGLVLADSERRSAGGAA